MKITNLGLLPLLQLPFACNESVKFKASSPAPNSQQEQKRDKAGTANIVYKSTDGGQSWQDISEGRSGKLGEGGFSRSRKMRFIKCLSAKPRADRKYFSCTNFKGYEE